MSATSKTEAKAKTTKPALAFVPRLMDLDAGAHYISVGTWTLRELIWAGLIPVVKIPRPADGVSKSKKSGKIYRQSAGEPMRRVLIRKEDLDSFIDGLPLEKEER